MLMTATLETYLYEAMFRKFRPLKIQEYLEIPHSVFNLIGLTGQPSGFLLQPQSDDFGLRIGFGNGASQPHVSTDSPQESHVSEMSSLGSVLRYIDSSEKNTQTGRIARNTQLIISYPWEQRA